MEHLKETNYMKGFLPYALAAFLVGIVGGLSTVLGPFFMLDMNLAYNNTTWSALAQAISTAACAPILGKLGDIFGRRKTQEDVAITSTMTPIKILRTFARLMLRQAFFNIYIVISPFYRIS